MQQSKDEEELSEVKDEDDEEEEVKKEDKQEEEEEKKEESKANLLLNRSDLTYDTYRADTGKLVPAEGLQAKKHGPSSFSMVEVDENGQKEIKQGEKRVETTQQDLAALPKLNWGPNHPQRTIQKAKIVGKQLDEDTEFIPCLYLPAEDGGNKVVIYFHGNAEDIGLAFDLLYMFGSEMGMHVLAVEYPGYGLYKTSKPDEEKMKEDADSIYDYLT